MLSTGREIPLVVNGEELVLSTGKEVLLVVDHSLNVLHGVVGLDLEGSGLTVAVLRKIWLLCRVVWGVFPQGFPKGN